MQNECDSSSSDSVRELVEKPSRKDRFRYMAHRLERGIELVVALLVLVIVVTELIHLIPLTVPLIKEPFDVDLYLNFLTKALDIVIGVEFFRLLATPDLSAALEVMMFTMTRHMIIENSSAVDNLLTVIGIALIAYLQYYLHGKTRPLFPALHRHGDSSDCCKSTQTGSPEVVIRGDETTESATEVHQDP